MPNLTFDDFGMPVWTNGSDATGTDPEPIAAAIAAVNSIGAPGGIPVQDMRQTPADVQPVGAPPAAVPQNRLINPADDSFEYAPGPEPLAPVGPSAAAGPAVNEATAQVGTAPVPASPIPGVKPAKPGKMDAVATANANVDRAEVDAAQANMNVATAQNEAARMLAERRAMAQENHAASMAQNDAQYQAARDKAQHDADMETAQWMADMEEQAKKEPNPKRWFANQSSFGKVMWLASLAFGTKAAATAPGVQNIGLAMMREEMDKDMSEQKARLAKEYEVVKMRGGVIDKKQARRLANLNDDHSIRAGQLLALEKAALERANAPGSADDQAAMMMAHKWLSEQRLGTAATRAQQAFAAKESSLSRAHAAGMQANAQRFEAQQNQLNRDERAAKDALDRAFQLEKDSAASKATKTGNTFTFDQDSGVQLVSGNKTAPLSLNTANEAGQKRATQVGDLTNAAQEVTAEMQIIKDAMTKGTFVDGLLGTDTNLQAAVARLGYSKAKENDPRGIVTDADKISGLVSAVGVEYDSVGGRFKTSLKGALSGITGGKGLSKEDMVKAIEREMAVVESRTNAKLNTYVPLEDRGNAKIVWRAKNRNPTEVGTPDLAQSQAAYGVDTAIKEPQTRAQLNEGLAAEKAGAKDALPPYQPESRERVTAARDHFDGMSADEIEKAKPDALKQVMKDNRAFLEVDQLADKAIKAAQIAEDGLRKEIQVRTLTTGPLSRVEVSNMVARDPALKKMTQSKKFIDDLMKAVDAVTPEWQKAATRARAAE